MAEVAKKRHKGKKKPGAPKLHPLEAQFYGAKWAAEAQAQVVLETMLDGHLAQVGQAGQTESSGGFTINQEVAVAKLGKFKLPFDGAWAVKLVQAVVASQSRETISFSQGRQTTVVTFRPGREWAARVVEGSLASLEAVAPDLEHLRAALWALMAEGRDIVLHLPGQGKTLHWRDHDWHSSDQEVQPQALCELRVGNAPVGVREQYSFLARKNVADVASVLASRCFVCPVPLFLDRRRLDALQNCPDHGQSETRVPLIVAFAEAELGQLPPPPGSFVWSPPFLSKIPMAPFADDSRPSIPDVMPSLGFQMSYHVQKVKRDLTFDYLPADADSSFHWVLDGAVLAVTPYPACSGPYALGVYLSAQGLETDLSGFQLVPGPEMEHRSAIAGSRVSRLLSKLDKGLLSEISQQGKLSGKLFGGAVTVAGVGSLSPLLLLLGGVPALAVTGGFGALGYLIGQRRAKVYTDLERTTYRGIQQQAVRWIRQFPPARGRDPR